MDEDISENPISSPQFAELEPSLKSLVRAATVFFTIQQNNARYLQFTRVELMNPA